MVQKGPEGPDGLVLEKKSQLWLRKIWYRKKSIGFGFGKFGLEKKSLGFGFRKFGNGKKVSVLVSLKILVSSFSAWEALDTVPPI